MGRRTVTGADGSFRLSTIPPSDGVQVWALHPDHAAGGAVVAVVAGETTDVVVRLAPARTISVTARVVDPDGHAVPGAEVRLRLDRDRGPSSTPALGSAVGAVRLDGDARRRLEEKLAALEWRPATNGGVQFDVDASARSFALLARAEGFVEPRRVRVTIGAEEAIERTIVLHPTQSFRVRVLDLATRLPVTGARVYLRNPEIRPGSPPPHVSTDDAGWFEVTPTTELHRDVFLRADGYLDLAWRLRTLPEGEAIELLPSHQVEGRIVLRDGTHRSRMAPSPSSRTPSTHSAFLWASYAWSVP